MIRKPEETTFQVICVTPVYLYQMVKKCFRWRLKDHFNVLFTVTSVYTINNSIEFVIYNWVLYFIMFSISVLGLLLRFVLESKLGTFLLLRCLTSYISSLRQKNTYIHVKGYFYYTNVDLNTRCITYLLTIKINCYTRLVERCRHLHKTIREHYRITYIRVTKENMCRT